uniref:RNA polymerase alpha subunit n=1 Tax=Anarthria humilis TaxID=198286 RepID=UPI001F12C254|nr:RNA polymerase alpha subunit [Anarthria humilis]YP_010290328.1 RNA polymerase alpha subunit [Anarthria humilis]ULQ64083.1 RNA polymerase alpha subunit [Anarthria humilis]ULQ64094.1 RNA polymerase alpha subunit [Anarthria humilis]
MEAKKKNDFKPKCHFEERVDGARLIYGRLVLSPLMAGQGEPIGTAMLRALLGEIEGTRITRVQFRNVPKGSATIEGVQESIYEILQNLKAIVFRNHLDGVREASICLKGPRCVTAQDIILPPSMAVVDTTQYIASVIKPINLVMEFKIKRDRGYNSQPERDFSEDESNKLCPDSGYTLYPYFSPIENATYSLFRFENGDEITEILILEVWTNGSLTPKEAIFQASRSLIALFLPLPQAQEEGPNRKKNPNPSRFSSPLFLLFKAKLGSLKTNKKDWALIGIQQLELPPFTYKCLKKANIKTLLDLLNKSIEDLLSMEDLSVKDIGLILNAVSPFLYR